jgi:hypothetical protein
MSYSGLASIKKGKEKKQAFFFYWKPREEAPLPRRSLDGVRHPEIWLLGRKFGSVVTAMQRVAVRVLPAFHLTRLRTITDAPAPRRAHLKNESRKSAPQSGSAGSPVIIIKCKHYRARYGQK